MVKIKNVEVNKVEVNKNNVFHDDDGDIEQDMKTLGQVRDDLLKTYKETLDVNAKISLANSITAIVHARENAEMFLLRVMGAFDDHHDGDDEYCPECDAENKINDSSDTN